MTLHSGSGVTPGYPWGTGVRRRSAGGRLPANESPRESPRRVTPTSSGTASWRYCGPGSALRDYYGRRPEDLLVNVPEWITSAFS